MDPTSTVLIVNPAAAAGRVARDWDELLPTLRGALGAVEVVQTTAPGDAIKLAHDAVLGGARTVLSLGGDGTHNEVVNGIMRAKPAPSTVAFGVLPSGTGGDLRRLMAQPHDMNAAARSLREGEPRPIDVGHVAFVNDVTGKEETRWFINVMSFGLGGLVDRMVNRSSKRLGGKATFAIATARALATYRPARLRIVIDGRTVGTWAVTNVAVANGRYFGGGMHIAPEARLADGQFDVVVLPESPLWKAARDARRLYDGTISSVASVETFRGATVEAYPEDDRPAYLDIDGEAPGVAPLTCTLHAGAIDLIGWRDDVL